MLIGFELAGKPLTSPSLACFFIRSSDSYFSFWFGTTRGMRNMKRGLWCAAAAATAAASWWWWAAAAAAAAWRCCWFHA